MHLIVKQILKSNVLLIKDGKYLLNGLQSTYFGMSEILGLGITVSGFLGYAGNSDSTAMTSECGQSYHLLGGAYLSSKGATIKVSYTSL